MPATHRQKAVPAGPFGNFTGQVATMWLANAAKPDRDMVLLADFSYTDPSGFKWDARKDDIVDGASIPSILWGPILGSPFSGDFRRASVVHDVACRKKISTSDLAHRMFYNAMRCDGTSEWLAKTMYAAVKMFGPQWDRKRKSSPSKPLTRENIDRFNDLITSDGFAFATLDELDATIASE